MKKWNWIFAMLCLASSPVLAEIASLSDPSVEKTDDSSLKAFVGFEADNILLVEDGSFAFSIRGGVSFNPSFRFGVYASTVANDVNTKYDGKNISVDYNALGLLGEFHAFRYGKFSVSIPVTAGAGFVNIQTKGKENSEAKDGFFVADAALHFNYQVTRTLEFGIGGGYRLFLGISEEGFDNQDFNTPFGAIFIHWGES